MIRIHWWSHHKGLLPVNPFILFFGVLQSMATGSNAWNQNPLYEEATRSKKVHIAWSNQHNFLMEEPKWWCVKGQWQTYQDAKIMNDNKQVRHIFLTQSQHTLTDIRWLLQRHKYKRMANDTMTYNKEIVWSSMLLLQPLSKGIFTWSPSPEYMTP